MRETAVRVGIFMKVLLRDDFPAVIVVGGSTSVTEEPHAGLH
jgi:hypothetical protein